MSRVKADETFAIVPEWLLYADIGANAVRLYATLRRYADKDGRDAYPSRRRLADHMRCSVDTVDRAMKELVAIEAVEVTSRDDETGGGQTSNSYLVRTMRPPSRTDAAGGLGTDAAGPLGTDAAPMNESPLNENPLNEIAPTELAARPQESGVVVQSSRPRDPIFEALFEVAYGFAYPIGRSDGLTGPARGALNRAAAELRAVEATPEMVRALPDAWVAIWPGRDKPTFTPSAAVKHWPALKAWMDRGYVARGSSDVDDLRRALGGVA